MGLNRKYRELHGTKDDMCHSISKPDMQNKIIKRAHFRPPIISTSDAEGCHRFVHYINVKYGTA